MLGSNGWIMFGGCRVLLGCDITINDKYANRNYTEWNVRSPIQLASFIELALFSLLIIYVTSLFTILSFNGARIVRGRVHSQHQGPSRLLY